MRSNLLIFLLLMIFTMGCNSINDNKNEPNIVPSPSEVVSILNEVTPISVFEEHLEENFEDKVPIQIYGLAEDESIKVIISADIDEDQMNYKTKIEFINKTENSIDLIADCGLFFSNDQYAPKNYECLAVESMLLKKNGNEIQSIILDKEYLNTTNKLITIKYRQNNKTKDLQIKLKGN